MQKQNNRTKENIKLGAASLINNDACIQLGRTRPWYAAVIVGILSLLLALIPTMVTNFNQSAGVILNPPTYDFDRGLVVFQEELNERVAMLRRFRSLLEQQRAKFQEYLKAQKDLGILLNVDSKNDYENAIAGIKHPDSELSEEDFVKYVQADVNSQLTWIMTRSCKGIPCKDCYLKKYCKTKSVADSQELAGAVIKIAIKK